MSVTVYKNQPCRWWFRGRLVHTPEYRNFMKHAGKAMKLGGVVEFATKIVQHRPDIYGYSWETGHMCVHETFTGKIEMP